MGPQLRIGNVQVLFLLGLQCLVWAYNPGLELFKFCSVWAHNSLSRHTIPDWKCLSFVASGRTTSCLAKQFWIGNVQVLWRVGPQLLVWAYHSGLEMFKFCCIGSQNSLSRLGLQLLGWAHNSGLEMFKFCFVWTHKCLSGQTIHD